MITAGDWKELATDEEAVRERKQVLDEHAGRHQELVEEHGRLLNEHRDLQKQYERWAKAELLARDEVVNWDELEQLVAGD